MHPKEWTQFVFRFTDRGTEKVECITAADLEEACELFRIYYPHATNVMVRA